MVILRPPRCPELQATYQAHLPGKLGNEGRYTNSTRRVFADIAEDQTLLLAPYYLMLEQIEKLTFTIYFFSFLIRE